MITTSGKVAKFIVGDYIWRRRSTAFVILSIIIAYMFLTSSYIHQSIENLGYFGYLGSFIIGIFYTYSLTTVPATVGLFIIAENLNPILIALTGAAGSVLSDFIIYRFVKDSLIKELEEFPIIKKNIHTVFKSIRYSKFLKHFIPLIAGFIIASPLPDELGASLFGAIKLRTKNFLLYSYLFNFIGILTIATIAKIL